jgi:hypothetical protein
LSKLGWLEPVFYGHQDDGEPIGVFSPEQWKKIQAGYACPRCWQEFQMVFVKCPVCQLDLKQNLDPQIVDYPEEWTPGPDRIKQDI